MEWGEGGAGGGEEGERRWFEAIFFYSSIHC